MNFTLALHLVLNPRPSKAVPTMYKTGYVKIKETCTLEVVRFKVEYSQIYLRGKSKQPDFMLFAIFGINTQTSWL